MSMGDRIRERLAVTGLSQAELARRVGLTQPTINALIRGGSRSSAHLHKIARVLQTTPEWLEHEAGDPSSNASESQLSSAEWEWVELLRALTPKDRAALTQIVRTLATSAAAPGLNDKRLDFRGRDEC